MRTRLRLLELAVLVALVASCKPGGAPLVIKANDQVTVKVRCTTDSTFISVDPAMAGISKQKGSIDFVLDQASTIDSISILPKGASPFNNGGPINGKKGSNGKGTLKSGLNKGETFQYQIVGECRVGAEPVKHLVIDPEVIIVD